VQVPGLGEAGGPQLSGVVREQLARLAVAACSDPDAGAEARCGEDGAGGGGSEAAGSLPAAGELRSGAGAVRVDAWPLPSPSVRVDAWLGWLAEAYGASKRNATALFEALYDR
jgi:hypothetical protein